MSNFDAEIQVLESRLASLKWDRDHLFNRELNIVAKDRAISNCEKAIVVLRDHEEEKKESKP